MSQQYPFWVISVSQGMEIIIPGGDDSFIVNVHALGLFLGLDTHKGMERVATDHLCLPALHEDRVLHLEGQGHAWLMTQESPCN